MVTYQNIGMILQEQEKLRCVPMSIIHDAMPWYYSNHLTKSPHLSISHKFNNIFIRINKLKGTKTYTTTALRMVVEGQISGYLIKMKIAGLVTTICNFSLSVQRLVQRCRYHHIKMSCKLFGTPYESNCKDLCTRFACCLWTPSLYTRFAIGLWSP